MGYDANIFIKKSNYTIKDIEDLILLLGYKKLSGCFYCGNDTEYKFDTGVSIWSEKNIVLNEEEYYVYHIRAQIWASGYDLEKMNNTLRYMRKYCDAFFQSDIGKNRYFIEGEKIKGAENGCYLAVTRLDNCFSYLRHSLRLFPQDTEADKSTIEFGIPSPEIFNANVYSTYLCAIIEEYFRSTYIALLRYSTRKEKVYSNFKMSAYDLVEVNIDNKTVEEVYARTLSFQNISKIVKNFKDLDSDLNLSTPLKQPYHKRHKSLYEQINDIFERRHNMVHHMKLDFNYTNKKLIDDIKDVKYAIDRVYKYICVLYGWQPQSL